MIMRIDHDACPLLFIPHVTLEVAPEDIERSVAYWTLLGFVQIERRRRSPRRSPGSNATARRSTSNATSRRPSHRAATPLSSSRTSSGRRAPAGCRRRGDAGSRALGRPAERKPRASPLGGHLVELMASSHNESVNPAFPSQLFRRADGRLSDDELRRQGPRRLASPGATGCPATTVEATAAVFALMRPPRSRRRPVAGFRPQVAATVAGVKALRAKFHTVSAKSPTSVKPRPTSPVGVALYDAPVRYPVEDFTPAERELLAPHFTNLDRPVFALVNLPETVKGRFLPAIRAIRGPCAGSTWRSSRATLRPASGPSTGPRASAPRSSTSGSSSATATTRSPRSAAPTSPASGSPTCSPRSSSAAASPPTSSSRPATSPTTSRCPRTPAAATATTATSELGPAVRRGDGRALRDLLALARARSRSGRPSAGRAARASRRAPGSARSGPRRSTCCAACCPRRR